MYTTVQKFGVGKIAAQEIFVLLSVFKTVALLHIFVETRLFFFSRILR